MDQKEFKIKVIPLGKKLHRFAVSLLKDLHEAEDIVQEIYVKLWKLRDDMEKIENIEAFAFRMTRNLCLDRIKAKKPQLYDDPGDIGIMEETDTNPDPASQLILSDALMEVHRIMGQLPEQQRTVLHLREVEGYSYEEISEVLKMEINAIRVVVSRARKTLRESLSKTFQPWKI